MKSVLKGRKLIYSISFVLSLSVLVFALLSLASNKMVFKLMYVKLHKVSLPEFVISVKDGSEFFSKIELSDYNLIIHYDSLACNECHVNYISRLDTLFKMADDREDFNIIVLFSPKEEKAMELVSYLKEKSIGYKLYVDIYNKFDIRNDFLPNEECFHHLLIDRNNFPIMVGNPVSNVSLWNLFCRNISI